MRQTLLLATLALAALLVATPLAAAQGAASLSVTLEPLDHPLVQGQAALLRGRVHYVADATSHTNTMGIPIQYNVKSAPEWASVALSPATDILMTSQPGPSVSVEGYTTFTALVIANHDAPVGTHGVLEITAVAHPAGPISRSASGTGAVAIVATAAPDPCSDGMLVAQGAGATLVPASNGALVMSALGALIGAAFGLAAFAAARRTRLPRGAALMLVLAAFALAAPGASAMGTSAAVVRVNFDSNAVAPGEQVVLDGMMEIVTDATGSAELSGMRVHYEVKSAPEWATVVLTPMDDVVTFGAPVGILHVAFTNFRVMVIPQADMTTSEVGLIEVVATVRGQFSAASASASIPVIVDVPPVCEPIENTSLEAQQSDAAASEATDDLSVQSAAPTTGVSIALAPVLAGCAIAGALVGLVLSRRLR